MNDIISATSLGTGEVLHVEIMSKFYFVFHTNLNPKHKCEKNYEGSSSGMEVAGVLHFFNCFLYTPGICYTKYSADGNSKAYQMVVVEKPYGPYISVTKLECIGCAAIRKEARLRTLVKGNTGTNLHVGENLGSRDLKQTNYKLLWYSHHDECQ